MKADKQDSRTGKKEEPESDGVLIHLIVFKLGTEEFAIRIEQVKEVTVTPDISRMPRTPAFIKGVANIRGDIIAIMDLEERFHIPQTEAGARKAGSGYTLVLEGEGFTMGILVKEVPQSLTLPVSSIDKTPGILQMVNVNETFIDGIAKEGNRLIVLLDAARILSLEEIEQLST